MNVRMVTTDDAERIQRKFEMANVDAGALAESLSQIGEAYQISCESQSLSELSSLRARCIRAKKYVSYLRSLTSDLLRTRTESLFAPQAQASKESRTASGQRDVPTLVVMRFQQHLIPFGELLGRVGSEEQKHARSHQAQGVDPARATFYEMLLYEYATAQDEGFSGFTKISRDGSTGVYKRCREVEFLVEVIQLLKVDAAANPKSRATKPRSPKRSSTDIYQAVAAVYDRLRPWKQ